MMKGTRLIKTNMQAITPAIPEKNSTVSPFRREREKVSPQIQSRTVNMIRANFTKNVFIFFFQLAVPQKTDWVITQNIPQNPTTTCYDDGENNSVLKRSVLLPVRSAN